MGEQDRSRRVLAFGIVLAVVGLIFAASYARAATFNERFPAATPKAEESLPAESWGIHLLLIINGKIARSVVYNEEVYPTSDACKSAILADTGLQERAQKAAKLAVESYGPTAALGIACAMQLD